MNNDYISRQSAIDWFDPYSHMDENIPSDVVISDLRKLPAADVRPVVYAKPECIFDNPYIGKMFTTCSRCAGKIGPKDKFCKHCGADMRGNID